MNTKEMRQELPELAMEPRGLEEEVSHYEIQVESTRTQYCAKGTFEISTPATAGRAKSAPLNLMLQVLAVVIAGPILIAVELFAILIYWPAWSLCQKIIHKFND